MQRSIDTRKPIELDQVKFDNNDYNDYNTIFNYLNNHFENKIYIYINNSLNIITNIIYNINKVSIYYKDNKDDNLTEIVDLNEIIQILFINKDHIYILKDPNLQNINVRFRFTNKKVSISEITEITPFFGGKKEQKSKTRTVYVDNKGRYYIKYSDVVVYLKFQA